MRLKKYKKLNFPITKWMLIIVAVVIVFSIGIVLSDFYYSNTLINKRIDEKFSIFEKQFYDLVERDSLAMETVLQTLSENEDIKNLYLEKDRDALYNFTEDLFEKNKETYGITHWYFIDKNEEIFLRVHKPDLYGDKVERATYKEARDTQNVSSGIEFGKTAFALRVVIPYYENEELIGYLELGREIDNFLDTLDSEASGSFSIVIDKEIISQKDWQEFVNNTSRENNWDEHRDYLLIAQSFPHNSVQETVALDYLFKKTNNNYNYYLGRSISSDDSFAVGSFIIKDASEEDAGFIYIIDDISNILSTNFRKIIVESIIVLSFSIFLIIMLYFIFRRISKTEEKYSILIENIPGAVSRFKNNKQRSVNFISDQISDITGFTKDEIINASDGFISFVHKSDKKMVKNKVGDIFDKNGAYKMEYRLKKKDKGFVWVKEQGRPVYNRNNDIIYFDAVIFNISDEKEILSKVKKSEKELKKINKFMIGRELKMIELKKEINDLKNNKPKKRESA